MNQHAIFCESFRDDFPLLRSLLDTYEKYCPSWKFLLSVPKADLPILKRDVVLPRNCDVIVDEEYCPINMFNEEGWRHQQVCKLSIHHIGYAEHFYAVDSDSYFISDITDLDIIESGAAKFFYSQISTAIRPTNQALLEYIKTGNS